MNAAAASGQYGWYEKGVAKLSKRIDYVKGRLRLFYVVITGAKKELIVTWNRGRREMPRGVECSLIDEVMSER